MATFSSFPGAAAGFAALLLLAVSAQVQVHAETTTPPGITVLASSDQFIFTDDACTQGREPWGRVSLLAKEEGCAQYWQGAVGKAPVTWNTVYQQTSPLAGGTAVDFLIYRDESGNCSGTGESSTGGVGYGAAQICAGYLQGVCTKVPSPLGDWKNGAGVRVGSFLMTTPFPKEQVAKSHFAELCASTQSVIATNATTNTTANTTAVGSPGPTPKDCIKVVTVRPGCMASSTSQACSCGGRVMVYIDQGEGFKAALPFQSIKVNGTVTYTNYGRSSWCGATVLDECYDTIKAVRMQNTAAGPGWMGDVTFSRIGKAFGRSTSGRCPTCSGKNHRFTTPIVVKSNNEPHLQNDGRTYCLNGKMCDISLPPNWATTTAAATTGVAPTGTTPPGLAVVGSSDEFVFTDDACTQRREPWGRVSLLAKEEGCAQYWQGAVGKAPVTWNTVYQQISPLAGGTSVDFLIHRDESGNCSGVGESGPSNGVGAYSTAQICAAYLQGACTKVSRSCFGDACPGWKNGAGLWVGSFLLTTPFSKEQVAKSHFAELCASTQSVATTNAADVATTTDQKTMTFTYDVDCAVVDNATIAKACAATTAKTTTQHPSVTFSGCTGSCGSLVLQLAIDDTVAAADIAAAQAAIAADPSSVAITLVTTDGVTATLSPTAVAVQGAATTNATVTTTTAAGDVTTTDAGDDSAGAHPSVSAAALAVATMAALLLAL